MIHTENTYQSQHAQQQHQPGQHQEKPIQFQCPAPTSSGSLITGVPARLPSI